MEPEEAPRPLWIEADLVTAGGEAVASVRIPNFNPQPAVLVWGNRTFIMTYDDTNTWVEVFAYVVPV